MPSLLNIDLDSALSEARMTDAWRKTVRTGLRNQPLKDLHDFFDVHRNISSTVKRLRADVLGGAYRPSPPQFASLDKRDGIFRRIPIPEPQDALLLQTIVEAIEPTLKSHQPSSQAYYSRSHTHTSLEDVDHFFGYPWWYVWPQFQQEIWKFAENYPYVVITDIANYFDSIPLATLRNCISALGPFKEDLLNVLFYILEGFVWRPSYIPYSGVGLPQINFDAPRLLAHAFLFRLDSQLKESTSNDFARWMDDINAGVQSTQKAKCLVRSLETTLNSQGLRLNASKTKILSGKQALEHFRVQDNAFLTIIKNLAENGSGSPHSRKARIRLIRKRFASFVKSGHVGQWDKIYKRYFSTFALHNLRSLEAVVPGVLTDQPSLRGAAIRYLRTLGYSQRRLKILSEFILSGDCQDDVSMFECINCIVSWTVTNRKKHFAPIVSLARQLLNKTETDASSNLTAALWLLVKYGTEDEIVFALVKTRTTWTKSSWASRQVAACLPRLSPNNVRTWTTRIVASGQRQALSIVANLLQLRELTHLDNSTKAYVLHKPNSGHSYPLSKVLISRQLLRSKLPSTIRADLRSKLLAIITDKRLRHVLQY